MTKKEEKEFEFGLKFWDLWYKVEVRNIKKEDVEPIFDVFHGCENGKEYSFYRTHIKNPLLVQIMDSIDYIENAFYKKHLKMNFEREKIPISMEFKDGENNSKTEELNKRVKFLISLEKNHKGYFIPHIPEQECSTYFRDMIFYYLRVVGVKSNRNYKKLLVSLEDSFIELVIQNPWLVLEKYY